MGKIIVWRYGVTGKLFETKDDFKRHLNARSYDAYCARREKALTRKLDARIRTIRKERSFADLARWIEAHSTTLVKRLRIRDTWSKIGPMKIKEVSFSGTCWLTAPRYVSMNVKPRGAPDTKADLRYSIARWLNETSYPGWEPVMYFAVSKFRSRRHIERMFENTGLHLSDISILGNKNAQFVHIQAKVTMFGLDFPTMAVMAALNYGPA